MRRRREIMLSTDLCRDAMAALDRIFALGEADEPDLGHNITYAMARRALGRLAAAEPWEVPAKSAAAIKGLIGSTREATDPAVLEAHLDDFVARVLEQFDRRAAARKPRSPDAKRRRAGDSSGPTGRSSPTAAFLPIR